VKSSRQHIYLLLGICATQVILGCADSSEVVPEEPTTTVVPEGATKPAELVGHWKSDSSGQELNLSEDGSAEFVNHVSINAANTGGQKMETKVPAKWATKDGTLYMYDFKATPAVSYKWSMKGGKLELDPGGRIKLVYSKVETKPKS
jgi:hypothetical protein